LGTVRFEPDLAQECIELAQGYDLCSGGPPFNSLQVRDVCEKVFRGTRAFDEACRSASFAATYDECQEGYCLREVDDFGFVACEGTCTSFQLEDHSCVQQQRCAPGLYCWDSTCVVPAVEGESCAAWPCASGLICGGSPATCRDPGPPGTTCEDNYDCAQGGLCNDGQCVINVAEGELCLQDATCQSGLYCRPTGVSGESRCAAPVAPYDDCDGLYDRCVGDYACSADLECVPLLSPLGAPCGPGGCEAGLWCDENQSPPTCAEARDEGGDCTWYASCRSGLLCMPDLKCHPPGQQGEICALDSAGSCAAGLFCDRETTLCQPVRALGQPCNPLLTHDSCQDGLYCACLAAACPSISTAHDPADVCAALKADGESCERETECENGQCLGGECSTSPEAPDCSR
jgi:hypothetical protein